MVILLIVILQLVSTALWVISSGLVVQRRIQQRVNTLSGKAITRSSSDEETKKVLNDVRRFGNTVINGANRVSVVTLRTARIIVNIIKGGLIALLPLVLVLDILVVVLVSAVGGGFLLLMDVSSRGPTGGLSSSIAGNATGTDTTTQGINKIVLVGDSRTYNLAITVGGLQGNDANEIIGSMGLDYVICKGGQGYDYMVNHLSDIESHLSQGTAVVIAMGVNGCEPSGSEDTDTFAERYSNKYATWLNGKAAEWKSKGVSVYYVSVNPVNDDKLSQYGYTLKNEYIMAFNTSVKSKLSGVGYIDTYSQVSDKILSGEGTEDGLHYDGATYGVIKDYIWKVVKGV